MDRRTAQSAKLPATMDRCSNIQVALSQAIDQLKNSPSASLDAQILLSHVLNKDRSYLFAWPEQSLSDDQQRTFQSLLERRLQGEPVAYITGEREFWSLSFKVNQHTLIPRPETELLVESALELGRYFDPSDDKIRVIDLGTGSGCIALVIAKERPDWQVQAIDYSDAALSLARHNADLLGIENVEFIKSNWFKDVDHSIQYDLVLANPPYIAEYAPHLSQGDVRFEPRSALVSGQDGLQDIRSLADASFKRLKKNGWIIFEFGFNQAKSVAQIVYDAGFNYVLFKKDLAGIKRHCIAHRP